MSPLWKRVWNAQASDTFYEKPSPTKTILSQQFIKNSALYESIHRNRNGHTDYRHLSIEGTPLFIFLQKKAAAGMTVEAAMVLPVFLFFFLNLSCALEMIRLQGNLELALRETGNQFSIYGAMLPAEVSPEPKEYGERDMGSGKGGILAELGDIALSNLYAKRAVIKYAGEDYLKQSPLTKGADGLQFMGSEIFQAGDCFELLMTYEVSAWMQMPGIRPFRMWNRYYGHFWNGYAMPGANAGAGGMPGADTGSAGVTVYVAENGSVYHRSRDCTYLSLTVREVAGSQIEHERNGNGGKYYRCKKCGKGDVPTEVFVGAEGERFHYDRNCSGLKRTFFSIFLEEADSYRPCSRCSGGG